MFVRSWMTADPVTVAPETRLKDALAKMEGGSFRRLPVLKGAALAGILTRADVEQGLAASPPAATCGEVMVANPQTAEPNEPIETAADRMRRHKVAALPVVQAGKLVGIVTESDIFKAFMLVMGAGLGGARITFDLEPDPNVLLAILEMARNFLLEVFSIATFEQASGRRWVTLRLRGKNLEPMIDKLWKSGYRVLQVMVDERPRGAPAQK